MVWNILHGGGAKRLPEIALALVERRPDVVVLVEFRTTRGGQLRAVLADAGLHHQLVSPVSATRNGLLIASRWPLENVPEVPPSPELAAKWLIASLSPPGLGPIRLVAVHIPDDFSPTARSLYWQRLVEFARASATRTLIAGDFNTGRHRVDEKGSRFTHTASLGELAMAGFVDLWRRKNPESRERTWVGTDPLSRERQPGGTRIDAVWASADLVDGVISAHFSHVERESGISDHSLLEVEWEVAAR